MPARDVADNLEVSAPTLYRWILAAEQISLYTKKTSGGF